MKNRTIRKKGGGSCPFAKAGTEMSGGSCGLMSTSQYGSSIYGDSASQQAVPGSGNLIAMNAPQQASLVGGKRRRRKGGSTVVDLGVPLVLTGMYASSTCRRRRKGSFKKSRRFNRRRR